MRTTTRIALTAGLVAGIASIGALPAYAVDDTTSATVEVQGGELSMTAPDSVALTAVAPGAIASGTLAGITVTDTRAGLEGWTASISVTDFTSATTSTSIPLANIGYVPGTAVVTGSATVVQTPATAGAGAVQTATAVNGNNSATWSAELNVQVPADALGAADYTAVLTHSAI